MNNILTKYRSFWICVVLTLTTAAVYYQVCTYDFVNYDDHIQVYKNPNIQAGITLKTVKWAFLTDYRSMWHPLTWLSHTLDWQLFGTNAGGHHLFSLIFHIANTLLLFFVLKEMTNALWPSAFVAALFALHPLHVESVAWVTERRDVLSTFFWILTMWAYVRYVHRPKVSRYLLVVLFFALGLMSKPMLVTLPFVLLLLDYWPLERFGSRPQKTKTGRRYSLPYLFIEKIPLFAMTLAAGVIAFIYQKEGGGMPAGEGYSFPIRLANISISYMQYIIKMIWPARLAMFYPYPGQNIAILNTVMSVACLLAITVLILRFAKEHRYLVTGWFWYLGTLVPVIGLVQIGAQAMADRYSYITLTGLFIIVAWGLPELIEKWPYRKIALWASSLIVLFALAAQTYRQQQYWKNSMALYQHALEVTNNNYIAYAGMANTLLNQNKFAEAVPLYNKALQIIPDFVDVRINFGLALTGSGKFAEAVEEYEKVLLLQPQNAVAHSNLGVALFQQGKLDEAIAHFGQAVQINPDFKVARDNLNRLLAEKEKLRNKAAHSP